MSKDCNLHPETVVELLNLGQLGTEAEPGQKQTNWKHLDKEQLVYVLPQVSDWGQRSKIDQLIIGMLITSKSFLTSVTSFMKQFLWGDRQFLADKCQL